MKYESDFFKELYLDDIRRLVLASYKWEKTCYSLSRLSFSHGLHPAFNQIHLALERTCGVFFEDCRIVSAVMNEGDDCGDAFFLFDSKERSQDKNLIHKMIDFTKKYSSTLEKDDRVKRFSSIMVPDWNNVLLDCVTERGYKKEDYAERIMIRDFSWKEDNSASDYEVKLPGGYTIADGINTPAVYRSMVHPAAFANSLKDVPHSDEAFSDLRNEKYYNPQLDLVILDSDKMPVATANIWITGEMSYCELEPLCVAWWERRKGLGSAILNEASNRVCCLYPKCTGLLGGDQPFYEAIGFSSRAKSTAYRWEADIYISWDPRSENKDYSKLL